MRHVARYIAPRMRFSDLFNSPLYTHGGEWPRWLVNSDRSCLGALTCIWRGSCPGWRCPIFQETLVHVVHYRPCCNAAASNARSPLDTFPRSFPVDLLGLVGDAANYLDISR